MTAYTHQTAPTQYVEANGIRFAYRRFGKPGTVPLVFNQHYVGTMDYWDPAVTDRLAESREVILFNNAGIASSSGEVPTTFEEMGANAIAFIKALGLAQVDVLGISIGGFVAQEITLQAADLVRKLILIGTGPRGGEGMASLTPEAQQIFGATYDPPEHLWLAVHFGPSEAAQTAGRSFLERKHLRQEGRDPEVNEAVSSRQIEAIIKWGEQRPGAYDYLKRIQSPTLVVNGSRDLIIYTVNSFILQQNIPNAQLILYPSANHGAPYQYPELFVKHATIFLDGNPLRGEPAKERDMSGTHAARTVKTPGPDHPITVVANPHRVRVTLGGRVIADTKAALTLREATYPPVQYIPREDIDMSLLERSEHTTYCPYKGECSYFSIPAGGERSTNAVWTYGAPYEAVAAIKDHLAFYPDRVDQIEERADA